MSKVLNIAVFIPEFKWERMKLHEIKPETHGIKLTAVDFDADLSQFDGLLHKFTYQLVDNHEEDVNKVYEYTKAHPEFIVIEPIDHIRVFTDRLALQNFIHEHPLPEIVEYSEGVVLEQDTIPPFDFPMIIKAVAACGTSESHFIQIVHDKEQLDQIDRAKMKLMAFPFINHHGVVFKCYALGSTTVMRAAGSLVLHGKTQSHFDSQKPLPSELVNDEFQATKATEIAPTEAELAEISKALEESTGVQLIGYDLLRRESDGKLVLVDFNYFPCFRQIENLPDKIADFIKEKAKSAQ